MIIALTEPIAEAAIDKVRNPRAIKTIASIGFPAISPHMLRGIEAASASAIISRNSFNIGADNGS